MTRSEHFEQTLKIYNIVSKLADKNGCTAFRLRHKTLGRDVVLHSFPTELPAYEVLCNIKTPCLPEIYDVIELEDGFAVFEEYIDGITVAQMLEVSLCKYRDAAKIIASVCDALGILHGFSLVHRDVKPENVIVDKDGRAVLIDFNATRRVSSASKDTVIMGTVGYASPEQFGLSQSDARSDIYAAGVMLNVMMTGVHPSERIVQGKAERIVRKCTNVNPIDRYRSASALADAL